MIARLLRRPRPPSTRPAVPEGRRVYAIGDVHGCLDLLDDLLDQIAADDARRGAAETHLVFLGDLVDRGPDSAGVIERVRELQRTGQRVDVLMGNHEESFLSALEGRKGALRFFLKIGGRETLYSYGLSPDRFAMMTFEEVRDWMEGHVPDAHPDWLRALSNQVRIGGYLFVHAGVRPDVPLEEQDGQDLRWIRSEFLEYPADHGAMIVHGHTISDGVEERSNRIGIDTGAYATGVLSAIGLEGDARWFLQAGARA